VNREPRREVIGRIAEWLDARLGLSYSVLRPVPEYAVSPLYWIGALTVVAFVIQGVTGVIMMLYYVPNPSLAFSSTQYIFNQVYYGRFLESVHLYTAYAMIMLAFMHMMRGYFVSVHKKPREIMWVVGMVMGFVTLGFGFTGYLLPWTIVSKSATDVGIGMIDALPPQLASFVSFLIVGAGGDATELLRFYDLHVVVLPAVLLVLLTVKMYMLETHGIADPQAGKPVQGRVFPVFPDMSLYVAELAAAFGGAMLLISVVFPLNLPPQYTPELAAQSIPQPDWYFLWIYQVLKIAIFEGPGLPIALTLVTLIFVLLIALPFIDRGGTRRILDRPKFVTLGLIFLGELVVLAYWGLVTPGQIISNEQGALVLGGTALAITVTSLAIYKITQSRVKPNSTGKISALPTRGLWLSLSMIFLISLGSLAIGASLSNIVDFVLGGTTIQVVLRLVLSSLLLVSVIIGTSFLLYRLDLVTGTVRKRIRLFESGWTKDESE
jgi:cytochrome b6